MTPTQATDSTPTQAADAKKISPGYTAAIISCFQRLGGKTPEPSRRPSNCSVGAQLPQCRAYREALFPGLRQGMRPDVACTSPLPPSKHRPSPRRGIAMACAPTISTDADRSEYSGDPYSTEYSRQAQWRSERQSAARHDGRSHGNLTGRTVADHVGQDGTTQGVSGG